MVQALYESPYATSAISVVDSAARGGAGGDVIPPAQATRTFAEHAHRHMDRLSRSHDEAEARIHPDSLTPAALGCGGGGAGSTGASGVEGVRCGGRDEVVLDSDGWHIAVNSTTGAGSSRVGTDWITAWPGCRPVRLAHDRVRSAHMDLSCE